LTMPTRVLCLVLVLATTLPIHAGCLATPTINSAYDSAPLIFRARVMQIIPVPPPPPPPPGWNRGTDADPMDHLRLQVLEVFKGDPGSEITVLGGDPLFGRGGEFLVFTTPNTKTSDLVANSCSRSGLVTSPRVAADLAWLRARLAATPTSAPSPKTLQAHSSWLITHGWYLKSDRPRSRSILLWPLYMVDDDDGRVGFARFQPKAKVLDSFDDPAEVCVLYAGCLAVVVCAWQRLHVEIISAG